MNSKIIDWKKGKGKFGILEPLLGNWEAIADSPMGKVICTRKFEKILGGNNIQLQAKWKFGKKEFEEIALFGVEKRKIYFKSFTSDGKNSEGEISEAIDIQPDAICFIAEIPAGIARMVNWPDSEEGFHWAVESKNKKGWNRFTHHHYKMKNSTIKDCLLTFGRTLPDVHPHRTIRSAGNKFSPHVRFSAERFLFNFYS